MTLHMIRLAPDLPRLARWAEREHLRAPRAEDDFGYALHAVLKASFGDLAPRPFALLNGKRGADLLGYSAHSADALLLHAQSFAMPDVAEAIGLGSLAVKQMPERFAAGQRLGFSVRVRPTVRTDKEGQRNRAAERDAFVPSDTQDAPDAPSRGDAYSAWLTTRLAAGGAKTHRLTMDQYRRSVVLRRNAARILTPISGPDATFSGVLEVIDPAAFAALLAHGVGRHGAFGYGMLLLKPG
jgi:CRISPR system Cascade subunit CasE